MISVIIPVYNVEKYLYVCLNSVLNQTYQNFEIICIDDCSTDSSLDILEYFSNKDSRIKILKNDSNRGIGYSRNRGLDVAQGEYILFLDGDDWFSMNAFKILVENVEKSNNVDLIIFKHVCYNDDSHDFEIKKIYENNFISKFENKSFNHFDIDKLDFFNMSTFVWNKFYSKSFLDKNNIRFSNENLIYENIPFNYNVLTSAMKILLINEHLYNLREKTDYLNVFCIENFFDIFDIYKLTLNIFLDNIQLYNYYKNQVLNHIFEDLNVRYNKLKEKFKERFFREVQNMFKSFIRDYGLYYDIKDCINSDILNTFKFDDIIKILQNPPKISIIVPIYNTDNELPNVLESIINQTMDLNDIEIILVDDCSNDNSADIIDDFSKRYENIIPIHLYKNSGSPSKPRNIGIQNATADYIIFQDSDDGFTPEACELLFNTIIEENVDIVTGMWRRNDEGKFKIAYSPWDLILNHNKNNENINFEDVLTDDNLFKVKLNSIDDNPLFLKDYALNSKIFKRSLLINNNVKFPVELNGGEDSVVLFNSFIKAKGIVFINKVIYNYNTQRNESLTHSLSLKTIQSRPKAYQLMNEIAISNNKKDIFINHVLQNKISYWFNEYLFKATNLNPSDISLIFKNQQIIFSECVNYEFNLSEIILSICKNIKNNNFDEATKKVISVWQS